MLVRQVANVLDLLEFFAEQGTAASLAEVSQHFGWPRSSAYNLMSTLSARGYLYEPAGRGKFYPTPRWLAIAQQITAAEPVPEELVRLAHEVRETLGETVCIGAAAGMNVVFLEVMLSHAPVRYAAEVGQRLPIHAVASGWSILSQWTNSQRAALLRRVEFERYGSGTPMSVEAVEDRIRTGLHNGWFQSASSFSRDLGGISIPLVVAGRVYCFTVAGPVNRIEDQIGKMVAHVHDAVARHFGPDYLASTVPSLTTPPVAAMV